MARDPLAVLLSVRQRSVDQSRLALASCLKAEVAAIAAIDAIDVAMLRESALADRFVDEQGTMEMYIAWRRRARTERAHFVAALVEAEVRTAAARADLAAVRSGARAVERTIEDRAIAARAEAENREQHALDDVTRARFGGPGRAGAHRGGV